MISLPKSERDILFFEEISSLDVGLVGGKGANLGELTKIKAAVPHGFCVTAGAYFKFLDYSSLKEKVISTLRSVDVNDARSLDSAARQIQTAILGAKMSTSLAAEITVAYHRLCGTHDVLVAVRSSATAEDLPEASFAGQQESFTNILGAKEVVRAVQKCWASLFEPRAIFYRREKGFDHFKVGLSAVVQIMVEAEVAGVMFTVDPLSNDRGKIAIEAAYGLAAPLVLGELTPDQYLVDKKSMKILDKKIVSQGWKLTKEGKVKVSVGAQKKQKLSDSLIVQVAQIGVVVENHYGVPQDIEWVYECGQLYLVQTRPVTTLKIKNLSANLSAEIKSDSEEIFGVGEEEINEKLILRGAGASPGVAIGNVRLVRSGQEIYKVKEGEVLVTKMTSPDFVPAMKKAVAVVTDEGGRTSHAAIVSRELGIPCVVGTELATKILKDGEIVTVDGSSGEVFAGKVKRVGISQLEEEVKIKTATKLYVNLSEPAEAEAVAGKNVDGVGLLRAEFMIAEMGKHPRVFLDKGQREEFIGKLTANLVIFAKAFAPRPVIYRATDFKTNEYRNLEGGEKYEGQEANPLLGFRGVLRYLEEPDVFRMELESILRVRNRLNYKNLYLMLPFVRTVEDLINVKKLIAAVGLSRSANFKLYLMVEVPANIIMLEEFAAVGIDGISIGSNDLAMLTLGVDRDNARLSDKYNEMNTAVLRLIEEAIFKSKKLGLSSSICGQAPSVYPELTERLVGWGIGAISVNPDAINRTRTLIVEAEKQIAGGKKNG